MTSNLATEDAIRARAAVVRRLGQFVGMFEWVCWSEYIQANVFLLVGSQLVDVRGVFAPDLAKLPDDCQSHTPVACKVAVGTMV